MNAYKSGYKEAWQEKYNELADEKGLEYGAIDMEIAEATDDFMGSMMYEQADHAIEAAKDDLMHKELNNGLS